MEQAEILSFAAELFSGKIDQDGDGIDMDDIQTAMTGLFGDDGGNLAIGSVLSSMNMGSLMGIASSWLGDGENEAISSSQVNELMDSDKLSSFASQLGISEDSALNGLTEALPALIDKSSSGGSLLDSVGGIDGVMSMAKKFFG
jgi:uncharacterized protein YidB (DUF937 family)